MDVERLKKNLEKKVDAVADVHTAALLAVIFRDLRDKAAAKAAALHIFRMGEIAETRRGSSS